MHKDIRLALAAAHNEGVPTPATNVADAILAEAAEHGYAHDDIAALFTVPEQMTTDGPAEREFGARVPVVAG